jgi:outer membrane protein OmpA-like peptidoglycan-associated protein
MSFRVRIIVTVIVAISSMSTGLLRAQPGGSPPDIAMDGAGQSPAASAPPASVREPMRMPRFDIFLGYSYLRAVPELANGNRLVDLNGGSASVALNLSRYFSLVADFGGYDDTQLRLAGPGENPPSVVGSAGSAFTYLFGPRLSLRNHSRLTPFAQVLFGAAHAGEVTLSNCTGLSCTPLPAQTAFALTAGGGFDIRLARHISLRAIQAEYLMTRFSDPTTGAGNTQNDLRLSTGLLFRLGGHARLAPAPDRSFAVVCSTDTQTVYAGSAEAVIVRVHSSGSGNATLRYTWTANGGSVEGTGPEARWSASAMPGTYTISSHVDDGNGVTGDCSSDIRVEQKMHQPPTIVCSADRSSVAVGEPAQLTATASDAEHDALTYTWSASGGNIIGSGSSVKLDTTGLPAGRYTVTARAHDSQSGTADCSVDVDAQEPTRTPLELRLSLHSIYFPTAQPTTANPMEGLLSSQKQMLISLAGDFGKYLESKPGAQLILEGHADPRGSDVYNQALSQRRVESTKRFLIEHGVSPAKIQTRAVGVQQNLTDAQVSDAVEQNPELTSEQKQKALDNMTTIILASNRRVDITLTTTGQQSARQYPFNAVDALALLSPEESRKGPYPATKRNVSSAPE